MSDQKNCFYQISTLSSIRIAFICMLQCDTVVVKTDDDMYPNNQEHPSLRSHFSRSSPRRRFHHGNSNVLSHLGAPPITEASASHKTTTTIDHLWSLPSITSRQQIIPDPRLQLRNMIFLHIHYVKHLQSRQLWTEADFSTCNPNNQVPIITIVTTN